MTESVFLLLTLLISCQAFYEIAVNNVVKDANGSADAGTFLGFPTSLDGTYAFYSQYTADNLAKAGDGVASSGNRLFFGGSAEISDSVFSVDQSSEGNSAKSANDNAVSGTQSVFPGISDYSIVSRSGLSGFNNAVVGSYPAATPDPAAIAGIQTQVGSIEDSSFYTDDTAYFNDAKNKQTDGGEAVAGIENAIDTIDNSFVVLDSFSDNNQAKTQNGVASSGVENAIDSVSDYSNVFVTSDALYNTASSKGDNAVSGVQDTIGSIEGGSTVYIDQNATGNIATSRNGGSAVSGSVFNAESVLGFSLDIDTSAQNNDASAKGYDTDSSDAVSGVAITVSDIQGSFLNVDALAEGNIASNTASSVNDPLGNDAVSGMQLTIGNAESAYVDVSAGSYYNDATAINGDAVAGNQINIGNTDSNTFVNLDLDSFGNTATSQQGTAVIDNDVNIGGAAIVTVYP